VAGRRRVDDDEVVADAAAGAALELGEVPDLPDRHQLVEPRRGGAQVLEHAAAAEQPRDRPRLELVAQPLRLCLLGVDRQREQAGTELALLVADRFVAEDRRQPVAFADLDQHRPSPAPGGREAERRGDRALADAALAGDEHEPLVGQVGHREAKVMSVVLATRLKDSCQRVRIGNP
jgi:hypothetical protein